MARYVTLYRFTEQGMRNVKDSPSRLKAGIQKAESMGMRIVAAYYTEGPYDLVIVSESSDEKKATAFALSIGAQGNVTSTTMRAYDPNEFEQIVKLMS